MREDVGETERGGDEERMCALVCVCVCEERGQEQFFSDKGGADFNMKSLPKC